jgi:hypothetical protein
MLALSPLPRGERVILSGAKGVIPNPVAFQTGEGSAVGLLWSFNLFSSLPGKVILQRNRRHFRRPASRFDAS